MKKSEASVLKQDRNWKNTARYLSRTGVQNFPAYLRGVSLLATCISGDSTDKPCIKKEQINGMWLTILERLPDILSVGQKSSLQIFTGYLVKKIKS